MGQIISAIQSASGNRLNVDPAGNIAVTSAGPAGANYYFHTLLDAPGVVAANNFMSVFNPTGSGKAVVFFVAEVKSYAIAAASAADSLTAFRTTAASGGTLISSASVSRFLTTAPNPVAEVRVDNPTTTNVGLALNGFPPPISTGAGTGSLGNSAAPSSQAAFTCLPGEGLVVTTASGDTDQRWDITLTWLELPL